MNNIDIDELENSRNRQLLQNLNSSLKNENYRSLHQTSPLTKGQLPQSNFVTTPYDRQNISPDKTKNVVEPDTALTKYESSMSPKFKKSIKKLKNQHQPVIKAPYIIEKPLLMPINKLRGFESTDP